jgi:hypothetical protein
MMMTKRLADALEAWDRERRAARWFDDPSLVEAEEELAAAYAAGRTSDTGPADDSAGSRCSAGT